MLQSLPSDPPSSYSGIPSLCLQTPKTPYPSFDQWLENPTAGVLLTRVIAEPW